MEVTSKEQMYKLLSAGAFGNTIAQYFSVETWRKSGLIERYHEWGVRTMTPGGPCRLFCPTDQVGETFHDFASMGHVPNISLMIDNLVTVTLWADVYDSETGVRVYGIEYPAKGASWRKEMSVNGKQYDGLTARLLLQKHLNPSSLADLYAVLEMYPGHVVELSACDHNIGTVPGRNGVLWEVRTSTGEYEKW